ncbi:MAG: hypothetical protein ABSG21_08515 [Spirochaetia bacterium]|jgi:hypothetical protein
MAGEKPQRGQFETRRRKEQVAFLVVKFLRMYVSFKEIAEEFHARSAAGALAGSGLARSGLFEKVAGLSQGIGFDLKELAHSLFRARNGNDAPPRPTGTREILAGMKTLLERRSLDSYIGTGFHLLLILQESLYQIERYSPELDEEKSEIGRIMELARAGGPGFGPDQRAELERLQALAEISAKLAVDSAELAGVVLGRCEELLEGTAQVIRRFGASASDNEILVLNLLENRDLVERVYGAGSAEAIFSELCARGISKGRTGVERARAFVRERCGNISGLEPGKVS